MGDKRSRAIKDKEDAQSIADLVAGLLALLHHRAQSSSSVHRPALERTALYTCELIAVTVRSSQQEFMLRTRQLPVESGTGGQVSLHQVLVAALEAGSPQVRAREVRICATAVRGLDLTVPTHQLDEAIVRALTALWRQAQPGTADMKARGGRFWFDSLQYDLQELPLRRSVCRSADTATYQSGQCRPECETVGKALRQVALNAPGNGGFVRPYGTGAFTAKSTAVVTDASINGHLTSHVALFKNSLFSQVTQYSKAAPLLAVLLQLLSDQTHPLAIRARAGFSLCQYRPASTSVQVSDQLLNVLAAHLLDGSRPLQETACNMEALLKIQRVLSDLEIPLQPYETPSAAKERALLQQVGFLAVTPAL